ncbi:zinc finger protein 319-like [Cylas formicarius]|uniref:zinc finger protein 319-like n=1 Tax=Cylas formicarius TaxID=197179 RepID=UPI002958DC25|nr:zinc finger protein 319-like [Cylas formicarius]
MKRHENFECQKPPRFGCKLCEYQCHRNNVLRQHYAKKHGVSQMFTRPDNLSRHIRLICGQNSRPFCCPMCQKRFKLKHHLKNHFKTDDKKKYMCPKCCTLFTRSDNLSRHMRVICGQNYRPFSCYVCLKAFKLKYHLKKHFCCVHPEHSFASPSIFTSRSVLEHACPNCWKIYKYKSNLGRHLRYECNKRPSFACPHCSKAYYQKSSLKSHVTYSHGFFDERL